MNKLLLPALLATALAATSCRYKLVTNRTASLPSEVSNLCVPLASNKTIEAGLEDSFTQTLKAVLLADGRVKVLEPGKAESELRCTLSDLEIGPKSYTREGRVAMESASFTASCKLLVVGSESVIWESGPITAAEEYPVGDDYIRNEDLKARALVEISKDLAETIRSSLLDEF